MYDSSCLNKFRFFGKAAEWKKRYYVFDTLGMILTMYKGVEKAEAVGQEKDVINLNDIASFNIPSSDYLAEEIGL